MTSRPTYTVLFLMPPLPTLGILETWLSTNRLRLNPSKKQFIWFGTRQQLVKLDLSVIAADFPHFVFSSVVRDLKVTLDQKLTLAPQIHCLSRDSYHQLRQLRTVIRSLTSESTATHIHAFITAWLDYCSSLYAGLPVGRLRCLDKVLRTAARLFALTSGSTTTLIHAFITARLDYCSSLYAGLPVGRVRCLDKVLHTAASLS